MVEMSGFQLGVMGALFLPVASSVSIVICNKALMSNLGFQFATTLTSWHLMVTYCSLHVAQKLNFFESKPIDMKTVIMFGMLNGVSIGLLNLSLGFNSIGFYQMTKLAIIPFTVLLETIFLKKQFSKQIKFFLSILLVGVGIVSVTDLQLNFVGTILSLLAIITTCIGQIAWRLYKEERSHELVDASLGASFDLSQALRSIHVGLLCMQKSAKDRPSMSSVVFMLGNEVALPQAKEPGFLTEDGDVPTSQSCIDLNAANSENQVTITWPEGR